MTASLISLESRPDSTDKCHETHHAVRFSPAVGQQLGKSDSTTFISQRRLNSPRAIRARWVLPSADPTLSRFDVTVVELPLACTLVISHVKDIYPKLYHLHIRHYVIPVTSAGMERAFCRHHLQWDGTDWLTVSWNHRCWQSQIKTCYNVTTHLWCSAVSWTVEDITLTGTGGVLILLYLTIHNIHCCIFTSLVGKKR